MTLDFQVSVKATGNCRLHIDVDDAPIVKTSGRSRQMFLTSECQK